MAIKYERETNTSLLDIKSVDTYVHHLNAELNQNYMTLIGIHGIKPLDPQRLAQMLSDEFKVTVNISEYSGVQDPNNIHRYTLMDLIVIWWKQK